MKTLAWHSFILASVCLAGCSPPAAESSKTESPAVARANDSAAPPAADFGASSGAPKVDFADRGKQVSSEGAGDLTDREVYILVRASWLSAKAAQFEASPLAPKDPADYAITQVAAACGYSKEHVIEIVQQGDAVPQWRRALSDISFSTQLTELQLRAERSNRLPNFQELKALLKSGAPSQSPGQGAAARLAEKTQRPSRLPSRTSTSTFGGASGGTSTDDRETLDGKGARRYSGKTADQWLQGLAESDDPEAAKTARELMSMIGPSPSRTANSYGGKTARQFADDLRKAEHPLMKRSALAGLRLIGPGAAEAVPDLVKEYESTTDPELRRDVISALASIGPGARAALPTILEAARSKSKPLSVAAIRALGSIETTDTEAIQWLAGQLRSDLVSASLASASLGKIGAASVPELEEALSDPQGSDQRRGFAAAALTAIGPEALDAIPALRKRLADPGITPMLKSTIQQALRKIDVQDNRANQFSSPTSKKAMCDELNAIMMALSAKKKYREAIEVGERLVTLAEGTLAPQDFITCLDNLAFLYNQIGDYDNAVPAYLRLIDVAQKTLRMDDPTHAKAANDLGGVYLSLGDYAKAERMLERAKMLYTASVGRGHPAYGTVVNNLGLLYRNTGRYSIAEQRYREALEMKRNEYGTKHSAYAASLHNLADLLYVLGRYGEAERLFEEALQIKASGTGESSADYAITLNSVARLHLARGDYAKAERLFRRVLEIRKQSLGEDHPQVVIALNNLAVTLLEINDRAKAKALLNEARAIAAGKRRKYDPGHVAVLNSLATLASSEGKLPAALSLLEEICTIEQSRAPRDPLAHATALSNTASICSRLGEVEKARSLSLQATAIWREQLGESHPQYATSLSNQAWESFCSNDFSRAESLYQQSAEIIESALGDAHPVLGLIYQSMARVRLAAGNAGEALDAFDSGLRFRYGNVSKGLVGFSNQQQRQLMSSNWLALEAFLSFVQQHPEVKDAPKIAAQWLARWKALTAEIQAERHQLLKATSDPALMRLAKQIAGVQAEISQLALSPPANLKPLEIRSRRLAVEQNLAALQRQLGQQSEHYARLRTATDVTIDSITEQLAPDSVLLDYAYFHDFDFGAVDKNQPWGGGRYAVFVIASNAKPLMVDLGPAEPIDRAIAVVQAAIAQVEQGHLPANDREIHEQLMAVRKLIIDPALPSIRTKKHWIVCPHARLALIPFEALALSKGRYLIEAFRISYFSAARDIALLSRSGDDHNLSVPLLFGDPEFNLSAQQQQDRIQSQASPLVTRGPGGKRDRNVSTELFSRLPATGREVEKAAKEFGGKAYLRDQALEGFVKQAHSPEILYLATHGFYLPDDSVSLQNEYMAPFTLRSGGNGGLVLAAHLSNALRADDPLLRCGLAFAGANVRHEHANASVDDGILTGLEVSELNLQGTGLVVLSACETGLGDSVPSEGVIGLKRAFMIAGAKRLVSTLWKVPDNAQTEQMMATFGRRWKQGDSPAGALRDAQIELISSMRRDVGHAHPFFWAAFTMTGDSR